MTAFPKKRPNPKRRGMTLMEVVIAIGVVAFVVPIILAATASSAKSRMNAEADTRSAWLAKEVHRQILSKLADPVRESVITTDIGFPVFGSESDPIVLAYDNDGSFLEEGGISDIDSPSLIPKAAYLVAIHGEAHSPPNLSAASSPIPLSLVHIRILHTAKSAPGKRSVLRYRLLTYRQSPL